ncbi:FUSC family protein [Mesorhizobium amorphae]
MKLLRAPAVRADAEALLFSVKTFAAAMLAYSIALGIGLPKPFWAIVTVYIVSQPSAAASLGRGIYRFAGTLAGAVATVAIVSNFVNDPIACSAALALWIGLCLFVSLLDRTPRAYAFVLAGYTASLIGFPAVSDPGAVFDTASVRVQEIALGILCAVLVHRLVLPRFIAGPFTEKLSATLRDARRLAGDALKGLPQERMRHDRHQLAADMLAIQGLATHLPYDPAPMTPRRETLQRIHVRLARLLPLASEIEERVQALSGGDAALSAQLAELLREIGSWVATTDLDERDSTAIHLICRARLLRAWVGADAHAPDEQLAANLAGHLAELVGLLHDCDRLGRDLAGGPHADKPCQWPGRAGSYVYHRDTWMAARAAAGAVTGIVIGCAFWIWSAWPDGAMAVSVLGVACALFGNVDAPAPNIVKYMIGSVYGVAISLAYSFVILPRVTDFAMLVAVLAPALLFAGSLQARPQTAFMALGISLTIPILVGLGPSYSGDFAQSLNGAVALFAATGFAVVSMTLFQTVPADTAIRRLLLMSRRDVGRRAHGGGTDEAHWASLMIDRTALILPRLRLSQQSGPDVLDQMLRHLRIGHAAGRLRKVLRTVRGAIGEEADRLLGAIAADFGERHRSDDDLIQQTDALIARISPSPDRARLLDLCIDLRFALGSTTDGAPAP